MLCLRGIFVRWQNLDTSFVKVEFSRPLKLKIVLRSFIISCLLHRRPLKTHFWRKSLKKTTLLNYIKFELFFVGCLNHLTENKINSISTNEPNIAEYNLLTETLFFFSRSSQPPHWKQHQVNQHRHRIPLHRTLPTRYEPHLADSIARFSADSNFDTGENDERTCHADHGAACKYWSVKLFFF